MRISDWSSDVCSSDLIDGQAYSLSGQYHFGAADNIVRPFVGLGYHETNYSNEKADGAGALAGQRIGVETAKGAVATVGVDVNITPTWFACADARYFDGDGDISLDGTTAGPTEFNPVKAGVGIEIGRESWRERGGQKMK